MANIAAQTAHSSDAAGASLTIPVTEAGALAGESLHLAVSVDDGFTLSTVASVPIETWTQLGTVDDATAGQRIYNYVANNITGGSTVITATFNSALAAFRAISVTRISNTSGYDSAASSHREANQANPGTSNDAVTTGVVPASGSITSQPCLINGYSQQVDGTLTTTVAAGTGFISGGTGWGFGGTADMRVESKRLTSTTAVAATFTTTSGTSRWLNIAAIFLESASSFNPAWGVNATKWVGIGA